MKNKRTFLFLVFSFCILQSEKTFPQAGQLDTSFGQNGIVTTRLTIKDASNAITSTALQGDGKIVVAGYSDNYGNDVDLVLARYNQEGSLDNTFGTGGIVITQTEDFQIIPTSLAIQEDGKIVIAGYFYDISTSDFAIARYNPDGSQDNTFGVEGIVTSPIGKIDVASSIAIQKDGKIIAAGYAEVDGNGEDFAMARYNPNGGLDASFGINGIVTTNIGSSLDRARSISLQEDGKIILSGYSHLIGSYDFTLVRYIPNGGLDPSFGTNGIVITPLESLYSSINSSVIQSDGRIIVAGTSGKGNDIDFTVARYQQDGDLDNTFGNNGILITPVGNSEDIAQSVIMQNDGKIVVAGYSKTEDEYDFAVARYLPDGDLDNTFGVNGTLITPVGVSNDKVYSGVIQPDGKIIVAGFSHNGTNNDFALVRYLTNGSIDGSFANFGKVVTQIGTSHSEAWSALIQNDEKIVVAGYSDNGSDNDFAVVRYNPDGTPDNTFAENGAATLPIGSGEDVARSIACQNDGKIVLAGYSFNGNDYDFALVRYKTNGFIDNTFGNNGIVTTHIGIKGDYATSILIQSDGKLVASGHSYNGNDYDFALVRYNPDGTPDKSFGINGVVTTPIGSSNDRVYSSVLQNDGKILAAGYTYNGNNDDFALVRYNSNGDRDITFGNDGIVVTSIGNFYDRAFSITIQSDGKIIASGYAENGTDDDIVLVRYKPNGDLDNTFGNSGKITTTLETSNERASSVTIQDDGKIVVAGYAVNTDHEDMLIVRYESNGDLDDTFGTNGTKTVNVGNSNDRINSIAIQNDGNIVAAGYSSHQGVDYSVFTVLRFSGGMATAIRNASRGTIPSALILGQNYPNPFRHSTEIRWINKTNGFVTLIIYDALGKPVETLVNRNMEPGTYQTTFDSKNLSGGIYFYKLTTVNGIETKQMILAR